MVKQSSNPLYALLSAVISILACTGVKAQSDCLATAVTVSKNESRISDEEVIRQYQIGFAKVAQHYHFCPEGRHLPVTLTIRPWGMGVTRIWMFGAKDHENPIIKHLYDDAQKELNEIITPFEIMLLSLVSADWAKLVELSFADSKNLILENEPSEFLNGKDLFSLALDRLGEKDALVVLKNIWLQSAWAKVQLELMNPDEFKNPIYPSVYLNRLIVGISRFQEVFGVFTEKFFPSRIKFHPNNCRSFPVVGKKAGGMYSQYSSGMDICSIKEYDQFGKFSSMAYSDKIPSVFLHEYGHLVWYKMPGALRDQYKNLVKVLPSPLVVSAYAKTNIKEDFAESFLAYVLKQLSLSYAEIDVEKLGEREKFFDALRNNL